MTRTQPLFQAIEVGDTEMVTRLLDREPDLLHARDEAGLSPVLAAAYRRHTELLRFLLERGARLDTCEAAAVGDVGRLDELVARDGDTLHARSADGWTPLHLACFFGQGAAAHRLLDAGADVHAWSENETRNTPLHAAIAGMREQDLIERLLGAGADVNAVGGGGVTPLHLAAARGDLTLIEALLASGARATRTSVGRTPAELATERGHPEAAKRLHAVVPVE